MTATLAMVCVPVSGLHVPSCSRCPWHPRHLSPLGHRSLECALVSAPFPSVPVSPVRKNKMPITVFGTAPKLKLWPRMSSVRYTRIA